jgi:hypothetical protein
MSTFEVLDAEDVFGDVAEQATELADFFDSAARVHAGDELGDVDGVKIKAAKTRTMVRWGDKELPARMTLYREDGTPRSVATADVPRLLAKPHAETGKRCFFVRPPVAPPAPIAETCPYCPRSKAGNPRPFYNIDDLDGHIENLHPSELARQMRREDVAARMPTKELLLGTIALMGPEEKRALRELLGNGPGRPPKEAS